MRDLEGQSRRLNTEYPLGIIELKGGVFSHFNAKVHIGPKKIQVYKSDEKVSDIEIIQSILRLLVVPAEDETAVIGEELRKAVPTRGSLEFIDKRMEILREIRKKQLREYEKKRSEAILKLEGEELKNRLASLVRERFEYLRQFYQGLVNYGMSGAKDELEKIEKCCTMLDRWEDELKLVQDPKQRRGISSRHMQEAQKMMRQLFREEENEQSYDRSDK